jgi:hypothetical protein
MQEKSKIYNVQGKSTNSPSNQAIWMENTMFQTQEGSKKNTRFLNVKDHIPPEPKVKHTKRQPQDKRRPLNQQSKSKHIWPRHKSHKNENKHQRSHEKPTRHPQQEKYGSQV